MPRFPPLYSDVFFLPLTEDVEELLARFQLTDSVRFEDFSAIWRAMGFSDLFLGMPNVGEMKRFCRVALNTAAKFFLPPHSYQIRVGALYLMFGFFHAQLASPRVKVRLALKDWAVVQKFIRDSADSGHLDVVYVFHELVAAHAMHYAAMPHFLFFKKQKKKRQRESVCAGFLGRTTAVQEFSSAEVLEEVANVQTQYEKLKEATAEVNREVTVTQPDFCARINDCVSEFLVWQHRTFSQGNEVEVDAEEEKQSEAEYCSGRARLLSAIKQKSYGNFRDASKSEAAAAADSSSSGAEQTREASGTLQRQRPPSLRARTQKSLGVTWEERKVQAWLLSVPETRETSPRRRGRRHHEPAASSRA